MRRFKRIVGMQYLFIGVVGVLGACSANSRPEIQTDEIFEPTINAQGVKEFELLVTLLPPERPALGGSRGGSRGGAGGNGRLPNGARPGGNSRPPQISRNARGPSLSAEEVDELIEEKMEETGYCLEGFSERERIQEGEKITVNGQCNEAATEEEMSQFEAVNARSLTS